MARVWATPVPSIIPETFLPEGVLQYSLSSDSPAGQQNYQYIDLKKAAAQVDFLTVDGYNYAGSWDAQTNDASLLTPGIATYASLANLSANGYRTWFDALRIAASVYDPNTGTFYTYDNPESAALKMIYVDVKVPGGLGGAYVWALKDDDANGTMVKAMAKGLGIK